MEKKAGMRLRQLREKLGLTLRDVENASVRIAARHKSDEYALPLSRLSEIENKSTMPSVYRLYSLAAIYRRDLRELLSWFGLNVNDVGADAALVQLPNTHIANGLQPAEVNIPVRLDPAFDLRKTTNIGRMIERWGVVPLAFLAHFANADYTYAYIGSEDLTMFPLLQPGSFVQVDESRDKVAAGAWRSELERPIYLIESRDGFTCAWCAIKGDDIIIQPYPLSPVLPRVLRHPQDAEVVGQVVGVAMRLDWRQNNNHENGHTPPRLN